MIKRVNEIISQKGRIIIAIDGLCASGKTTLANELAGQINAQLIHMDDFFLPKHMRTEERFSQAGGNVHYERFCDEVIAVIKSKKPFKYGIYSCSTDSFKQSPVIFPEKNIIIEGSYALHPEIPDIYDFKIFLETDGETQLKRILKRNGQTALEAFESKWIPFENFYFEKFNIKSKCDVIIST